MSRPQSAARFAWLDLLGSAQTYTGLATFSGGASVTNLTVGGTNTINTSWTTLGATQGGFQRGGDTGYTAFTGGSALAAANGAYVSMYGTSHGTNPGQLYLVPGTGSTVNILNGAAQNVLKTESTGLLCKNLRLGDWDGGSAYQGLTRNGGATNSYMVLANATDTFISTPSASGVINLRPGVNGVGAGGNLIVGMSDYSYNNKSQVSYGLNIDASGTGYGLPSGWSTSKVGTGQYRITHNKGDTNYTLSAVIYTASAALRVGYVVRTANTCDLYTFGYNNTVATDASLDIIFHYR